jgi:hypothetical protein
MTLHFLLFKGVSNILLEIRFSEWLLKWVRLMVRENLYGFQEAQTLSKV